jgi:uncharacterized protein YvpB
MADISTKKFKRVNVKVKKEPLKNYSGFVGNKKIQSIKDILESNKNVNLFNNISKIENANNGSFPKTIGELSNVKNDIAINKLSGNLSGFVNSNKGYSLKEHANAHNELQHYYNENKSNLSGEQSSAIESQLSASTKKLGTMGKISIGGELSKGTAHMSNGIVRGLRVFRKGL